MSPDAKPSMRPTNRVRVHMACSLDGFIAGPDHDLAWLHRDHAAPRVATIELGQGA